MNNEEYVKLVNEGKFDQLGDITVPNDKPFIDERGQIDNIWLGACGSVSKIFSKKGSDRASHTHIDDWHGCHIISGSLLYTERYFSITGEEKCEAKLPRIYKAGETVFSKPGVWHKMEFPYEDCLMITFNSILKNSENYEKTVERKEL